MEKRIATKLSFRKAGVRRAFPNSVRIGMVRKWVADKTLPMATFERWHDLPAASLCKWRSLLPRIERADPAGLAARRASSAGGVSTRTVGVEGVSDFK